MTQFASTLYPQTNPSNPILLRFRENGMQNVYWRDFDSLPTEPQMIHARLVMGRLARLRQASLSG